MPRTAPYVGGYGCSSTRGHFFGEQSFLGGTAPEGTALSEGAAPEHTLLADLAPRIWRLKVGRPLHGPIRHMRR